MSAISGNSVSFNLQKFEYKEGKIDKREMAKAVFKMAKEGDQEASAIVNKFKSVEGLYNAIKDKMGGTANAVENLFSNVPLNLFKPKFLSKNKWKINTKALKDYVAERRTLKRDEKTVSNEMQPNASLPKVQTEQKVASPEVKKEQSTPDPVQTPVIDTQPLDIPEPIDTKQKAIDILENIQRKMENGGRRIYSLAPTLTALRDQCGEFLQSFGNRQGKLLQGVGNLVREGKIEKNVYFQCQNLLKDAQERISETGIYEFDGVLSDAGKEVQKINEKIQELNKIAETGEGDVDACEHDINKSFDTITALFINKTRKEKIPSDEVADMPIQILKIANKAFDDVIKLVGEENKDTIEALRNEFYQSSDLDVKTEQNTPNQVQTPVIDTQPLDAMEAKNIQEMHASIKNHYHGLKNLSSQITNDLMPKLRNLQRNDYITPEQFREIEQECRSLQENMSQQTDIVSNAIAYSDYGDLNQKTMQGTRMAAQQKADEDVAIPNDKMGDVYRQMNFGMLEKAQTGIAQLRIDIGKFEPTQEEQEVKTAPYREGWREIQAKISERMQIFENLHTQYDALVQQLKSCELTDPNDIRERDSLLWSIANIRPKIEEDRSNLNKLNDLTTLGLDKPVEFPEVYDKAIVKMNEESSDSADFCTKHFQDISSRVKALLQKATGTASS